MALLDRLPPSLLHRDFRIYFLGSIATTAGSQFSTVAMFYQMYELTSSPFMLAMLGLSRAIPQIGLALVGGLLADAMDRSVPAVKSLLVRARENLRRTLAPYLDRAPVDPEEEEAGLTQAERRKRERRADCD